MIYLYKFAMLSRIVKSYFHFLCEVLDHVSSLRLKGLCFQIPSYITIFTP
uniref:Uncharacterized protein n=1 Tax=Arundo donax TaxID=35708 RepID=A0A0A8YV07_ARUDO